MAKNLKLKIKNEQIAAAVSLGGLKEKLAKKKAEEAEAKAPTSEPVKETKPAKPRTRKVATKAAPAEVEALAGEIKVKRVRARSRSAFAEPEEGEAGVEIPHVQSFEASISVEEVVVPTGKSIDHLFHDNAVETEPAEPPTPSFVQETPTATLFEEEVTPPVIEAPPPPEAPIAQAPPATVYTRHFTTPRRAPPAPQHTPLERLGPTGRHVRDLLPKEAPPKIIEQGRGVAKRAEPSRPEREKVRAAPTSGEAFEGDDAKKGKTGKFKEYRDVKPTKPRSEGTGAFDSRARQGLRLDEEQQHWRRRRQKTARAVAEPTIRPSALTIRLPISIKDLAGEMKLKASQLIEKLFLQGIPATINDSLDDATVVQLLGTEFGCDIAIDTKQEERIRITDKTIKEEVAATDPSELVLRPPVVTFMGHVDHGKTSLIDAIRKSNRAAGEAGAITQHIGAFQCHTAIGDLTIIDTPGHEAFSAMRARGADVTDIVVLVVAGDEGIKAQTLEAIQHAKDANVTIVIAINKCDKPNFNAENVYRQLSELELLPEVWGGQTITVNCSAVTGEGIPTLLEMLALQTEVLELKASPIARARGAVIEVELHKGMGATATVLVQNGTLHHGDAIVFDQYWGRVKTMRDDRGQTLKDAAPSTPVEITGLSGLPAAGYEFIVVANEREARDIAEARMEQNQQVRVLQAKPITMEGLIQRAADSGKKMLNVVLRADVRGSLEAMKIALEKIQSSKVDLSVISSAVGEISESDIQLASTSGAVVLGFHTAIESHADALVRQLGVKVRQHDVIFHAVDDIKELMGALLDKIEQETDKGKAEVKAIFKSSHLGNIAGCQVTEGTITRNNRIRVLRDGEVIWKGPILGLRRVNEDVREVQKGFECGIVLNGFQAFQVGDVLEAYEVTYITQEL